MALKKNIIYWEDKKTIKEIFWVDENGQKQGDAESYYATGQLWGKEKYLNNKLEGDFVRYYPDGSVVERGTYHQGWLNGPYEVYDQQGALVKREIFRQGWLDQTCFMRGKGR